MSRGLKRKQLTFEGLEARSVLSGTPGLIGPPVVQPPAPCGPMPPAMEAVQDAGAAALRAQQNCQPGSRLIVAALHRMAEEVRGINVALDRVLGVLGDPSEDLPDAIQEVLGHINGSAENISTQLLPYLEQEPLLRSQPPSLTDRQPVHTPPHKAILLRLEMIARRLAGVNRALQGILSHVEPDAATDMMKLQLGRINMGVERIADRVAPNLDAPEPPADPGDPAVPAAAAAMVQQAVGADGEAPPADRPAMHRLPARPRPGNHLPPGDQQPPSDRPPVHRPPVDRPPIDQPPGDRPSDPPRPVIGAVRGLAGVAGLVARADEGLAKVLVDLGPPSEGIIAILIGLLRGIDNSADRIATLATGGTVDPPGTPTGERPEIPEEARQIARRLTHIKRDLVRAEHALARILPHLPTPDDGGEPGGDALANAPTPEEVQARIQELLGKIAGRATHISDQVAPYLPGGEANA